jgi:1,4-alpha-glucan branching enzyme
LTPVLADQFEAAGGFLPFARDLRGESHRIELEKHPELEAPLRASAARYEAAVAAWERRAGDLVRAFAPHAQWTSSATHAVLPLLATDAGVRLQVATGIASHRERFGAWDGGFWLPECAYAPWLDRALVEAGVRRVCVDLTDVLGPGAHAPLRTAEGLLLVPIDREIVELVWSDGGYPSGPAYANTHHLTETCRHKAWANDGSPYDAARARAAAREDAADFVARARARERLSVCAIDTELLGDWWPEGVDWLEAVLEEATATGLDVVPLDEALRDEETVRAPELPVTTWGTPRDLSTWSGPAAGGLAWRQRRAELDTLAPGAQPGERALRELLAFQASDWAFLISRGTAGPYPAERADAHEAALREPSGDPRLRAMAPWLRGAPATLRRSQDSYAEFPAASPPGNGGPIEASASGANRRL